MTDHKADDDEPITPRQEAIVARVQQYGFVAIEALAREFDITPQTVRRDINALCARRLLQRYHGGAGLPPSTENLAYETREGLHADAKRRIADLAATHIPDHAAVAIGLGTTAQAVGLALKGHRGLRAITNNLRVAATLSASDSNEVMLAGGIVRQIDAGVTGESAIDFFRSFRVDYALMSISGIEEDGSLMDFDYHEVRLLQAILASARRRFLLADASKYRRHALIRVANISDFDALFTDRRPSGELARVVADAGVAVYVTDTP
ncbi:DeoR/GlpR family DNA-binding transcription regulator [Salinisphaera sp. Q1T1-3]|uniref:DeoR/GlpR family DNA-binding transcription regulator n=1 Tax=Salinisphaera sp. Q1T1-3 TaxID=2321229 RepID=UPI000E71784C|nr:DeoR/GlpR family DNA-binding transcription regulator [Salinisphaera sp. Q1T1-3]RJS93711.1 DeoR/GlpR transcriptional regulator [Salinisphaera sp. Q1T1-3]